jgi:hypothetical protein
MFKNNNSLFDIVPYENISKLTIVECSKIGNKVARDVSGKHKEADFYFVCE